MARRLPLALLLIGLAAAAAEAAVPVRLKDLAPSTKLRQWFSHDPDKWDEFRRRYFRELQAHPDEIRRLRARAQRGPVTIVFGSRQERFNNAVALQEYLRHPGRP